MKTFIIRTFLFLTPIIAFAIALELLLQNIPNDYKYKKDYLDKNSSTIEALFMGNSHAYFGVNPTYVSYNCFNGAHISQSLDIDLAILEKYKHKLSKIKYIIIPIDYFTLESTLQSGVEEWRVKNYIIYYDINLEKNIWKYFEIFNGKLNNNFTRIKSYYIDKKPDISCNSLGFGTTYKSTNSQDLLITGKMAVRRHTIMPIDTVIFNQNISSAKKAIAIAKELNAQLIFITYPAYKTYTENINRIQLKFNLSAIHKLTQDNPNIRYYNLLTDTSFVAQDFYDADHLNEIGAKKLTQKIGALLK